MSTKSTKKDLFDQRPVRTMVIAPAMTIPGTNHFASTPDVIAVPFLFASVNEP